jgi:hypothetical protein
MQLYIFGYERFRSKDVRTYVRTSTTRRGVPHPGPPPRPTNSVRYDSDIKKFRLHIPYIIVIKKRRTGNLVRIAEYPNPSRETQTNQSGGGEEQPRIQILPFDRQTKQTTRIGSIPSQLTETLLCAFGSRASEPVRSPTSTSKRESPSLVVVKVVKKRHLRFASDGRRTEPDSVLLL